MVLQVLQVLQVSQDQWGHLEPLERVVWDILDNKAHQDLPDPLATLAQVNLVPQVALENQVPLVSQVREGQLAQLEQWVPEVHLVHLEHMDLLDFLLLENLDPLASLGQWDQEESLV